MANANDSAGSKPPVKSQVKAVGGKGKQRKRPKPKDK